MKMSGRGVIIPQTRTIVYCSLANFSYSLGSKFPPIIQETENDK